MLYLKNITEAQTAFIPKGDQLPSGLLRFKFTNTTNDAGFVADVIDLQTSGLYFRTSLNLPEGITPGEYKYSLEDNNGVLSCGLLIIMEDESGKQYDEPIEFTQYGNNA